MRKISSRHNKIIKEAAINNWTDVLREIRLGPGRGLSGTNITSLLSNPKGLASFSALSAADKATITSQYPNQVGRFINNGVPTMGTGPMPQPAMGQAIAGGPPVATPIAPPSKVLPTPPTVPSGTPPPLPASAPPPLPASTPPKLPQISARRPGLTPIDQLRSQIINGPDGKPLKLTPIDQLKSQIRNSAPGIRTTPEAVIPAVRPGAGAAVAKPGNLSGAMALLKRVPKGKAGVGAAIVAGTVAMIPWVMQEYLGSGDRFTTLDQAINGVYEKTWEMFSPVWGIDVNFTLNPFADRSGDLEEIPVEKRREIVKKFADAALNGDEAAVSGEEIYKELEGTGIASAEELNTNVELNGIIISISEYLVGLAKVQSETKKVTQTPVPGPTDSDSSAPLVQADVPAVPSSETEAEQGLDYAGASKRMMEKGYLSSPQDSWTPEFDTAFRAFIDAGTKAAPNIDDTNLVGGQTWGQAASITNFNPDARGALAAVRMLSKFVGSSATVGTEGQSQTPQPEKKPEQVAESGKLNVLADIVSVLYNEKIVGDGGFLSNEKKQTQSFVDTEIVGGAGPSGFLNAARILMKRNPQLESVVPDKISMPVDKRSIKKSELRPAFEMTQRTIHDIFENANSGSMINPGKVDATENVNSFLQTPAGGSWPKRASVYRENLVKMAEARKERIREEIAARLTPAERAQMRRLKMRGV